MPRIDKLSSSSPVRRDVSSDGVILNRMGQLIADALRGPLVVISVERQTMGRSTRFARKRSIALRQD